MTNLFQPAKKSQRKLKALVTGPSGSGKTYSSLVLASELGAKIALIDTENASASLYSDKFKFDTAVMHAPFSADKYLLAMHAAVEAKYDVLVIDSLSHAWMGEGGILQQKEALDARGGNSFTNWAKANVIYQKLISGIIEAPIHIISTLRSKTEYSMKEDDNKRKSVVKLGMSPQFREGFDFEVDLALDFSADHRFVASKDRLGLFGSDVYQMNHESAQKIVSFFKQEGEEKTK